MLKSNPNNLQYNNLTVELFREALVDLLVEAASLKTDPDYTVDDRVLGRFNGLVKQAEENSKNVLSDYHGLFKIIESYYISGLSITQLDQSSLKDVDKNELLSKLQELYNNLRMFTSTVSSAGSSLFLVG